MAALNLQEVDSLEISVIVDNELDPISPSQNPEVQYAGLFRGIQPSPIVPPGSRGDSQLELAMSSICCAAHGLSLMITATKDDKRHTLLFDTGPEEDIWARNAGRLKADIGSIERIHLSHWHRDHSGGMVRAIQLINDAKKKEKKKKNTSSSADPASSSPNVVMVVADLHPDRPNYRGMRTPMGPVSLEADPSFAELEAAGAKVETFTDAHAVLDDFFLVSGEIPRTSEYEVGIRGGLRFSKETGEWTSDELIRDERLVMCNLKGKGIVVFTGCSHAGVVNAARHALELGNGHPLFAVVGGFHLADGDPEKLQNSVDDLMALEPRVMMPGHCTGWRFKYMIEREMPGVLVPSFTGTKYMMVGAGAGHHGDLN